jgi:hypothetical protein
VIAFASVIACSIGNTYVVVVDVDTTRMLATIDVGGAIIMISQNIFFQEKSYRRFPKCIVDRTVQL